MFLIPTMNIRGNITGCTGERITGTILIFTQHIFHAEPMNIFKPELIIVPEEIYDHPVTRRILKRFKDIRTVIEDGEKNHIFDASRNFSEFVTLSKKKIYIKNHKGKILKKCPGTKEMICCNYYIATFAENCPFDCSYCFLQSYINNPFITIYINFDDFITQLNEMLGKNPGYRFRIGTGEFTDSIGLDEVLDINTEMINLFRHKENALLELKTKSDRIDNLLKEDHGGNTVISWSLNPQSIIDTEELDCASLDERIEAAVKCQNAGYKIGFHFDPVIHFEGWEKEYAEIINMLSKKIDPSSIAWISLGTFRYVPALKPVIKDRFPESGIIFGEHVPCADGKLRYVKPIRVDIYSKMLKWIREYGSDIFVYLCMETRDVWEKVFGWSPRCNLHLNELFDKRSRE